MRFAIHYLTEYRYDAPVSDNLNVRHYMNITRVARPIPERVPSVDDLLGGYFARWGR